MATNLELICMHRGASCYETIQERFEEGAEQGID